MADLRSPTVVLTSLPAAYAFVVRVHAAPRLPCHSQSVDHRALLDDDDGIVRAGWEDRKICNVVLDVGTQILRIAFLIEGEGE